MGRQTELNSKLDGLNEQLFNYETEIVEISTNSELAGELGPLKYLSGLTGIPMDKIINWLLLTIVFVFDPLAIALVIAANFAFEQIRSKTRENIYGEEVDEDDDNGEEWGDLDETEEPEYDLEGIPEEEDTFEFDLNVVEQGGNEYNLNENQEWILKNKTTEVTNLKEKVPIAKFTPAEAYTHLIKTKHKANPSPSTPNKDGEDLTITY